MAFWSFHGRAYDHNVFSLWIADVKRGNEECKQCRVFRRGCRVCLECGEPCQPMEPHRYFPGWEGELPVMVTGEYGVMSSGLQDSLMSTWSSLNVSSNGVHYASIDQMVALNFDGGMTWSDLELLSDLFSSMTSGYCRGIAMGREYRESKKGRSNG